MMWLLAQSEDYSIDEPILTLNSGENRVCLELSVTDDLSLEYNETFELELDSTSEDSAVVNVLGIQRTVLTILDDDSE